MKPKPGVFFVNLYTPEMYHLYLRNGEIHSLILPFFAHKNKFPIHAIPIITFHVLTSPSLRCSYWNVMSAQISVKE